MRYLYKKRFLEAFDALHDHEQELVRAAEAEVRAFHSDRTALQGLKIKRLYHHGDQAVYEARAGLALRILWAEREGLAAFVFLGRHDQVRRFLKGYR